MSSNDIDYQAVPRTGNKGTAFTATVDEPDPNNPGQYLVVDLTNGDPQNVWITFRRPDKSTFSKLGIIYGSPTNGQIRYADGAGIIDYTSGWQIRAEAGLLDGTYYKGSWSDMPVGD